MKPTAGTIGPLRVHNPSMKYDKWHFLSVGAQWDRDTVPIFEAAARGRCVPLLKTLLTSRCTNDCSYCEFRFGRRIQRQSWKEDKLAKITMQLWKQREITGLFLTSSVFKDPDYITERQLTVLRMLREAGYTGYIHLRLMPGVSKGYIREAVELADRLGINLEAPTADSFSILCPNKGDYRQAVLKRLEWVVDEVKRARNRRLENKYGFGRSGVDTQMIVGALGENDWQHLETTVRLYEDLGLRRVFYSAFKPIENTPLEDRHPCPSYRERRLYQCSFLVRDYGFKLKDFVDLVDDEGFLPNVDPKILFVKRNPDLFPVDLNEASYYDILKIPRVGPVTARKIIAARNRREIRCFSDLENVVGPCLAHTIAPYIHLKEKRLTYFLKIT